MPRSIRRTTAAGGAWRHRLDPNELPAWAAPNPRASITTTSAGGQSANTAGYTSRDKYCRLRAPVRVRPLVLAPAHLAQACRSVDDRPASSESRSRSPVRPTVLECQSGPEIRRIGPIHAKASRRRNKRRCWRARTRRTVAAADAVSPQQDGGRQRDRQRERARPERNDGQKVLAGRDPDAVAHSRSTQRTRRRSQGLVKEPPCLDSGAPTISPRTPGTTKRVSVQKQDSLNAFVAADF